MKCPLKELPRDEIFRDVVSCALSVKETSSEPEGER